MSDKTDWEGQPIPEGVEAALKRLREMTSEEAS